MPKTYFEEAFGIVITPLIGSTDVRGFAAMPTRVRAGGGGSSGGGSGRSRSSPKAPGAAPTGKEDKAARALGQN